ncbi:hypothetical protein WIS52_06955 [Pseudonocardia nematodicida]|uniref:Uncharacterized protein n=1 Tax=Pseudonocardia nematodicida TaxID=1206997 RepID=A0ABV1K6T9_9PSEU
MMQVVDHEPRSWFLMRDGDRLYLDVNCNHGAFGYSVLIELDGSERRALDEQGRGYLHELADAVHMSAPAARDSTSPYRDRDQSRTYGTATSEAVAAWRRSGGS